METLGEELIILRFGGKPIWWRQIQFGRREASRLVTVTPRTICGITNGICHDHWVQVHLLKTWWMPVTVLYLQRRLRGKSDCRARRE